MREYTCCFSGHREISDNERRQIRPRLREAVETLIARGVTDFITGGAYGFDAMAAQEVLYQRKFHPIRLILALPCPDQTKNWPPSAVAEYESIRAQADEEQVLSMVYHKGCMLKRNDWMVAHSAYLICYRKTLSGGTAYTVKQATKADLRIRNLAKPENI